MLPRMPWACPVEAHVCCYCEFAKLFSESNKREAPRGKPWHLSVMQLAFGSNQRESSTGQARGIKAIFHRVSIAGGSEAFSAWLVLIEVEVHLF
jgi:hypothetical protein